MTTFDAHTEDGKLAIDTPRLWKEHLAGFPDGTKLVISVERRRSKRTDQQNKALHVYYQLLADELNGAGYPIKLVLSKYKTDIDWDMQSVKDLIWRPIQKALLGKTSTTELSKQGDIENVYEHINRFVGENFGVFVPFPVDEQRQKEKAYTTEKTAIAYPTEECKEPTF